jgi:nitrogen fixation NifU-like protein
MYMSIKNTASAPNRPNEEIYQARILDHYKNPRNKHTVANATITEKGSNPSCGDMLTLYITLKDDTIAEAAFTGNGCAVSQAAASLLTEKLVGMKRGAAAALSEQDVFDMLGITVTAGRKKCALLAWNALQAGLREVVEK